MTFSARYRGIYGKGAGVVIWTVGHSTHSLEQFIGLLWRHRIETLVDIRSYPGSRRYPWFGREALAGSLAEAGVEYVWMGETLGGRRRGLVEGSGNEGWRVAAFRSYADYASTNPAFLAGLEMLELLASEWRVAYMCSEYTHRRCHRGIVSDWLLARGWDVEHILSNGKLEQHQLPAHARVEGLAGVRYPAA